MFFKFKLELIITVIYIKILLYKKLTFTMNIFK